MIFAASGATRPFNGRVVGPLETELHGSFDSEVRGPIISELPALDELSYVALSYPSSWLLTN